MTENSQQNSYRVTVNENSYLVTFGEDGSVRLDGAPVAFDIVASEIRNHFSMLLNHESYLVGVVPGKRPEKCRVYAGGYDYDLEVLAAREAYLQEYLRAAGVGRRDGKVQATMPGMIRRLLIRAGDTVKAGDGVVIMEAMKMENEIRSPVSGVVTKFGVVEGQAVEKGAFLFEVAVS